MTAPMKAVKFKPLFRRLSVFIIFGLLASVITLSLVSSASSSSSGMSVTYERFDSLYHVGSLGIAHDMGQDTHDMHGVLSNLSNSSAFYYFSNATYNSTYSGESVKIEGSTFLYALTFGKVTSYSGNISIRLNQNGLLNVDSQIPQLIRVIVSTSGMSELVWAGLLMNGSSITTLSYVNETGTLTLVFINGTSLVNVTFPLKEGVAQYHENLDLVQATPKLIAQSTHEVEVQQNFPRRYAPEDDELTVGNSSVNSSTNYNTTLAYFNGSLVPALVWKGEGLALTDIGFGKLGVVGRSYFQFSTIEFFGVNGTVLGYVHDSFLSKEGSRQGIISSSYSSLVAGELKVVTGKVTPPKPEVETEVKVNGEPAVIIITNNGLAESTASVNLSHPVFVVEHGHGEGAHLVEVSINGTYQFFVVTPSGNVINVTPVKPANVTETVLNVSGGKYPAQRIVVQANGSIIFNVSVLKNQTVTVYKEVNGNLVALNSSNYFVVNGKLVVYDDPSNVYYAVYGAPSTTTSTTSTSTSPSSTGTSAGLGSLLPVVAIVVVILVIAGAVFFMKRK
ncbi:hypothetical protein GWK48_00950 [Metallosphaera tengchongensis]|uniref:Uncharacterized protein n=2 Tax=Metallosphaera tengchongensis TaxID=1532350 RepID=A0A6N0NVK4_9CREN|nr:hypothetical protein GWK48_00950 [Metallosphaera tengchongensis]